MRMQRSGDLDDGDEVMGDGHLGGSYDDDAAMKDDGDDIEDDESTFSESHPDAAALHCDFLSVESRLYASLSKLGWIRTHAPVQRAFRTALHSVALASIWNLIASLFDTGGMLDATWKWNEDVLVPWVRDVVGPAAFEEDGWGPKLEYAASECFVRVRMDELFDLVAEHLQGPIVLYLRGNIARPKDPRPCSTVPLVGAVRYRGGFP